MGTFAADLKYALRMLRSSPGFTSVAVAALALGIAANTAIFTVINAVLLHTLPFPEPDRIMRLARLFPQNNVGTSNSIPKYMVWRNNQVFDAMTLYGEGGPGANLGTGDRPEQVRLLRASDGYFRVFGVSPQFGRVYTPEEDLPNGPKVAVLTYGLWLSHFGGEHSMIGKTILLNGEPHTVLGVLQKGFQPDPPADIFLPLQADPNSTNQGHYLRAAGRLKPGISVAAARAEMKVVGERFRALHSKWMDRNESVAVTPLQESVVGDVRKPLLILLGAVTFVLLIACANVANLLLARAAVRQKEMALRVAVGANRGRIIRQLLTESVLLAGMGGVLGFALGIAGVRGLLLLAPGNIPLLTGQNGLHTPIPLLDWRVALFTFAVVLLTGIVFGLYPALQTSNPDLASTLKEAGGRSGVSRRQHRARAALVIAEIAMALVLLTGAALLIRTFIGLRSVNPGFDPHHVLTMETSMSGPAYATTASVDRFVTQVTRRIELLPGVEASAAAIMLPVQCCIDLPLQIPGKPLKEGQQFHGDEQWRSSSVHYFQVLRIPLLRGRAFRETDTANAVRVVVINDAFAKKYWPKEDAIGQVMVIGKGLGPEFEDAPRQVIGIVGNVREAGLERGEVPVMYLPQGQVPEGITSLAASVVPLSWAIRTNGDSGSIRRAIEREVRAVDAMMPVAHEQTMEQIVGDSLARQDFNMVLLTVFAASALLLAAIGIYGLMAYTVQQRTQEIGIRMALGARRPDMLKLVMAQGMRLALGGLLLGLALSYALMGLLRSMLFGVAATDPVTFGAVAALLALVAVAATFLPARRASSVEPVEALRYQ
jgi:predicted permease